MGADQTVTLFYCECCHIKLCKKLIDVFGATQTHTYQSILQVLMRDKLSNLLGRWFGYIGIGFEVSRELDKLDFRDSANT